MSIRTDIKTVFTLKSQQYHKLTAIAMLTLRFDAEHGQAVAVSSGGVTLHFDLFRQCAVTKAAGQCSVQETGVARKL